MDNLTDIKEIWQKVMENLGAEIGVQAIDLWIRPIKPLFIEGDNFKLEVPNSIIYNTVKSRYEEKIASLLSALAGRELKISYSMSMASTEPEAVPAYKPEPSAPAALPANYFSFNPNYTFESFIMGTSNRFAFASAEGVAKTPGQTNPFFIYSAPGLGKTHLLHAIAHGIFKNNAQAKILYTASENFVNEYIDAVRHQGTEAFRSKYRKLDCLLLDDIQFLVDKERSEEEFFYTFNSLFESKKQIVVTSDRPPRELALGQRLISRFLSGVVADIKIPDFETRVAILRQKRDQHKYDIPDDIVTFIAENVKKSIRELEGCLITVGNFCTNMKIQPSIDAVKEIIKDHITDPEHDEKKVTVELIKDVVAAKYNMEIKDFSAKKRTEAVAFPRQVAMYLACSMTDMSLNDIGDAFGRDHATVMYAKNKIGQMVQTDPYFNETLNQMISKIKNVSNS